MPTPSKPKVLIVDDLVSLRKTLSQVLKVYDLTIASSFEEAVSIIEANDFVVAILDIRLEYENVWNVDGLYLLKQLKAKNPNCGVIIFTGHRDSIWEESLSSYNHVRVIDKDETVNIENVRDIVKEFVNLAQ